MWRQLSKNFRTVFVFLLIARSQKIHSTEAINIKLVKKEDKKENESLFIRYSVISCGRQFLLDA